MAIKTLYRAMEILRHQGPAELAKRVSRNVNTRIDNALASPYVPIIRDNSCYRRRVDNEYRWDFIKPHLETKGSCLDIGCAQGYFSSKAATEGLLSLGVDVNEDRLKYAQQKWGYKSNLGFAKWELSPSNVDRLPNYDVCLLLTVYHHFVRAHGVEGANSMLRSCGQKSDILVCEMPGDMYVPLSITYTVTNLDSGVEYEIEDYSGKSWSHTLPRFSQDLPAGDYNIQARVDGYAPSNEEVITIGKSGNIIGNRPRVKVLDEKLEILIDNQQGVDETVYRWYSDYLTNVLGEETRVIDDLRTPYDGGPRDDFVFVLDTSGLSEVPNGA